jgi:hypothetical protein
MKKAPRGRRVNATGRSVGDSQHVRLYRYELESVAYRSLSLGARALLVELKALFNGSNNGSLFMSVREAAKRLNSSKSFAADRFQELHDRGFIRPKTCGAFSVKCLLGEGRATNWILTEHPFANALPTKDFMRWRPDEVQNAVRPGGRTVRPGGHSSEIEPKKSKSVRPGGRLTTLLGVSRSAPADTVSLPREVA